MSEWGGCLYASLLYNGISVMATKQAEGSVCVHVCVCAYWGRGPVVSHFLINSEQLPAILCHTCDYTTCNNNVDTKKLNKKIRFWSKTFCDALCTIHLHSTPIYSFKLWEVMWRSNESGSVGQKTAPLYEMLTSDSRSPLCVILKTQWACLYDHENLIIVRFLELSDYSSDRVNSITR